MHKWGQSDSNPFVVTIFSAPNYCGSYKNTAAVLLVKNGRLSTETYKDVKGPHQLPEGHNLFSYSLPLLQKQVS